MKTLHPSPKSHPFLTQTLPGGIYLYFFPPAKSSAAFSEWSVLSTHICRNSLLPVSVLYQLILNPHFCNSDPLVCLSVSLSPLSHTHRVFITINLKHFEKKKILATYWPHVPVSCSSEWKKIPAKRGWKITALQGNMLILSNIILVCPQLHVSKTFQKLRKHHLWKRSGKNDEETNVYLQISFTFFWLEGKKKIR